VEYRQALLARYREGQSVETIADQLGRSYKAAESLLSRARRSFQKLFSETGDQ
jgi:DNA-directed RNA polymerase specialized sigma24 family protein